MARRLSPWELDNQWLLHESVQSAVPSADLAHLVCTAVREVFDLDAIEARYENDYARRDNYPAVMTALWLYALQQGLTSSRDIARALETRVDFMALTGMQSTDFEDIRRFRRDNEAQLRVIAVHLVRLFETLGLPLAGKGNNEDDGERTAVGFGRSEAEASDLAGSWLRKAAEIDAQEDVLYGDGSRGDAVPDWLATKAKRSRKLREAQTALEREAKAKAEAQRLLAMDPDDEVAPPPRVQEEEPADDFDFERERAKRRGHRAVTGASPRPRPPAEAPPPPPRPPDPPSRQALSRPASREVPRPGARRPPSRPAPHASHAPRPDNFLTARSQEERVLLLEIMIATALSDGNLAAIERRRIDQMIRILRLDTRARQGVYALLRDNAIPPLPDPDALPDYDVRLHVFEQAAIMALADGVVHPLEKQYLRDLAHALELDVEDAKQALLKANSVAGRVG